MATPEVEMARRANDEAKKQKERERKKAAYHARPRTVWQRKDSTKIRNKVLAAIQGLLAAGEQITPRSVSRKSGVSFDGARRHMALLGIDPQDASTIPQSNRAGKIQAKEQALKREKSQSVISREVRRIRRVLDLA